MRRTGALLGLVLILLLSLPARSEQQNARATVQANVETVLKVLGNPSRNERQKRAAVRAEAHKLFDFVELSKRTLGLNWNRFSMEQRKEYVGLYKQLLEETYMDRLMAYAGEQVLFKAEIPLDSNTVEVRGEVITKTGPATISFRMINAAGQWKVYDVVIEGVSLIANYRSQFREILANQEPDALLDTLRKRVKERS